MVKAPKVDLESLSAGEILKVLPPAKRAAMIRAAQEEIITLLEETHLAVGFPKTDGRWNSMLCQSLEAVRQRILNPTKEHVDSHKIP